MCPLSVLRTHTLLFPLNLEDTKTKDNNLVILTMKPMDNNNSDAKTSPKREEDHYFIDIPLNNDAKQKAKIYCAGDSPADVECLVSKCKDDDSSISKDAKKAAKIQTGFKRYLGLTLAIASSLAFSFTVLAVKMLPGYHASTTAVWRFAGVFFPSLPLLLFYRCALKRPVFDPIWPPTEPSKIKIIIALLCRGIFGCTSVMLQYSALKFMDLGDCTVIVFCTPVFVTIVARVFLGEKCGIVPVMTAFLTLIGVVVISRPPLITGQQDFNNDILIGTFLSFGSMMFATLVFVILRYLRQVHFALVTSSFGIIGITESMIVCFLVSRFESPQSGWEWFLGICLAVFTFIGQSLITLAFKFEQAGPVALTRTFDVIFAFVWQFAFLGVQPDIYSVIGASIVVGAVIIAGIRKGLSMLPEDSPSRRRYWFILK